MRVQLQRGSNIPAAISAVAAISAFIVFYSATGSLAPTLSTGLIASISSLLFWLYLLLFVLLLPLKESFSLFREGIRKNSMKILFAGYLAIHLIIYGIFLELILETIYIYPIAGQGFLFKVFVAGNYAFSPHNLATVFLVLTLNPSVSILFPRALGVALGPFAIFSAIIIDILVIANVNLLLRLKRTLVRVGGSLVLPAVGVVGGASCCLSIPSLLAIASPSIAAFLYLPTGILIQNILYYGLPLLVIVILALNLRTLRPLCR
ncbi:MAG: hypothetical protein QXV32_04720 [Conexivisphaerales archaeon]